MTTVTPSKRGAWTYIHVNQFHIKHNLKNPDDLKPVFTVKRGNINVYGYGIEVDGKVEGVYDGTVQISCGARVVLRTKDPVHVKEEL